ncbi:MAG: DUF2461 domain-containing protein [Deltaproteobacteria bacterium]|nr:DUF2461 domain-containing protein [Deltaproteobacteria bacterium]
MSNFTGFPKEMITFFDQLSRNNSKVWFDENRRDYEDFVKSPSIAFVESMREKLRTIAPEIIAIPKVNQSLFRINRDTRFSHDKRPYKTNLGLWFWEGYGKRMECSGFYFHFEEGKIMLGVGIYMFPKTLLERYRDLVVQDRAGKSLRKTVDQLSRKEYILGGQHYKRIPHGFDGNHKNADLLLQKGLTTIIDEKIPEVFHTKEIIDYSFKHFKAMAPLHYWLRDELT